MCTRVCVAAYCTRYTVFIMSTLNIPVIVCHLPNCNYAVICLTISSLLLDYEFQEEKVDMFLFSSPMGRRARGSAYRITQNECWSLGQVLYTFISLGLQSNSAVDIIVSIFFDR